VTFELRWLANDPDASARAIVNSLSNTHDVADFSIKSMTT
ncbi:MgtC/SapB family protein, partial [Rhizobium ruizarguesonis]